MILAKQIALNPYILASKLIIDVTAVGIIENIETFNLQLEIISNNDATKHFPLIIFEAHINSKLYSANNDPKYRSFLKGVFSAICNQLKHHKEANLSLFNNIFDNRALNKKSNTDLVRTLFEILSQSYIEALSDCIHANNEDVTIYAKLMVNLVETILNFEPSKDRSKFNLDVSLKNSITTVLSEFIQANSPSTYPLITFCYQAIEKFPSALFKKHFLKNLSANQVAFFGTDFPPLIHYLIRSADTENINFILSKFPQGEGLLCLDEHHNTPIHVAAQYGHSAILTTLLEKIRQEDDYSILINKKNHNGHTPSMISILNNNHSCLLILLKTLTPTMFSQPCDPKGLTALDYLIKTKNWAFINNVLNEFKKNEPNFIHDNVERLLETAASTGDIDLITKLYSLTSTQTIAETSKHRILLNAIYANSDSIVNFCFDILKMSSNTPSEHQCPLGLCAQRAQNETFKILLKKGVSAFQSKELLINAIEKGNVNPLDISCLLSNIETLSTDFSTENIKMILYTPNEDSPLLTATNQGKHLISDILISHFIKYKIPLKSLRPSPLKTACKKGYLQTYLTLLKGFINQGHSPSSIIQIRLTETNEIISCDIFALKNTQQIFNNTINIGLKQKLYNIQKQINKLLDIINQEKENRQTTSFTHPIQNFLKELLEDHPFSIDEIDTKINNFLMSKLE
jgi:hypothetical protein